MAERVMPEASESDRLLSVALAEAVELTRQRGGAVGVAELSSARAALHELGWRLSGGQPSGARIALIGTTSSGKSSLVNTLLGEAVLPTDSDELSAGTVTLRHAPARRPFRLDWPPLGTACTECAGPQEQRARVRAVLNMHARRQRSVAPDGVPGVPPVVELGADLSALAEVLCVRDPASLQIADTPGVRRGNVDVAVPALASVVQSAIPVVIASYHSLLDTELLEPVGELLASSCEPFQRGVSPVLVLNKVDLRQVDDKNLAETGEQVSATFSRAAGHPVPCIPLCGWLVDAGLRFARAIGGTSLVLEPAGERIRIAAERARVRCRGLLERSLPLGSEDLRLVTLFWRAVEDGRPLSLDEAARVARILFDAGGGDRLLAGLGQAVRAADCGELAALPTLQEVAGIGPPSKQAASARFKAVQVGLRTAYECVPRQSEAQRCLVEGLLREYGELFAWDAELGPTSRARGSVSPRTLRRYASRARFPEEQLRWLRGALQLIAHLDGPADEATLAELEDVERALDGPKGRRRSKMRGADPVKRRRARRQ